MAKKNRVGRPKLPKGEAKGRIVLVHFAADDIKAIEAAARVSEQTVSEWIQSNVQLLLSTFGNSDSQSKLA